MELNSAVKRWLKTGDALVNLASNEYFKAIVPTKLENRIINPVFKEYKNGKFRLVTVYFKKARGMMTRFIIQNRINNPDDIKHFEEEGYFYNHELSSGTDWYFTR